MAFEPNPVTFVLKCEIVDTGISFQESSIELIYWTEHSRVLQVVDAFRQNGRDHLEPGLWTLGKMGHNGRFGVVKLTFDGPRFTKQLHARQELREQERAKRKLPLDHELILPKETASSLFDAIVEVDRIQLYVIEKHTERDEDRRPPNQTSEMELPCADQSITAINLDLRYVAFPHVQHQARPGHGDKSHDEAVTLDTRPLVLEIPEVKKPRTAG